MTIHYVKGDATKPEALDDQNALIIIPHIVNDIGAWGSGFVLALDKKWPEVGKEYRNWASGKGTYTSPFKTGKIQPVLVMDDDGRDIFVVNMVAQNGVRHAHNPTPINYVALDSCLGAVANFAYAYDLGVNANVGPAFQAIPEIHMPRIGAGLAGGKWDIIEDIIKNNFPTLDVVVYRSLN